MFLGFKVWGYKWYMLLWLFGLLLNLEFVVWCFLEVYFFDGVMNLGVMKEFVNVLEMFWLYSFKDLIVFGLVGSWGRGFLLLSMVVMWDMEGWVVMEFWVDKSVMLNIFFICFLLKLFLRCWFSMFSCWCLFFSDYVCNYYLYVLIVMFINFFFCL